MTSIFIRKVAISKPLTINGTKDTKFSIFEWDGYDQRFYKIFGYGRYVIFARKSALLVVGRCHCAWQAIAVAKAPASGRNGRYVTKTLEGTYTKSLLCIAMKLILQYSSPSSAVWGSNSSVPVSMNAVPFRQNIK
jgi:hypothetical protein